MLHFKLCMKCICIFVHEWMLCISIPIYASKLQSKGCKINVLTTHKHNMLLQGVNMCLGTKNRHCIQTLDTNTHTRTESPFCCNMGQVPVKVCVFWGVVQKGKCLWRLRWWQMVWRQISLGVRISALGLVAPLSVFLCMCWHVYGVCVLLWMFYACMCMSWLVLYVHMCLHTPVSVCLCMAEHLC